MAEDFISEPLEPVAGSADARGMVGGGPGLPGRFRWRGREYAVAEVVSTWKEDGPCKSGAREQYLRKHWYHIRAEAEGETCQMKIYFERQARSKGQMKKRWWIYTVTTDENI